MQSKATRKTESYLAGGLMVVLGLATIVESISYPIGELSRMGPGYFPVMLGVILVALGLAIPYSRTAQEEAEDSRLLPDRPMVLVRARGALCIIGGVLVFMMLVERAGLAPASFALVFVSALGDRTNTIASAAALALVMTVLGAIIFFWSLQLQIPLIRLG